MKTLQNLIMMLMISSVACWAEGQIGHITGNAVQIRAKGANFYERLGEFSAGTEVNVLSESNGWSEIQLPPTVRLWIQEEYLDDDGMVNSDVACLYAGQSTRFSKVKVLPRGTMLNVAGVAVNKLVPVYAPKGATGWVSSSYVKLGANSDETAEVPAMPAIDLADTVQQTMENNQRVEQENDREKAE